MNSHSFSVLAATYTSAALAEIDIKALRAKTAWRYRQDIFPDPAGFGIKILSVAPSIVKYDGGVYTHRLKIEVFVSVDSPADKVAKYKEAIELRTKRFDVVRPRPETNPEEKPEEAPAAEEAPVAEETPAAEEAPKPEKEPAKKIEAVAAKKPGRKKKSA